MDYYSGGFKFLAIILGIFIVAFWIIGFWLFVFYIVGQWKVFKKANQPGWASLIPGYNYYIMCKITGTNPWWSVIGIISLILIYFLGIGKIIFLIIYLYFKILLTVGLSKSYGEESIFAIGLIIFPSVFYMILGFNSNKYLGQRPMKDLLFDIILKQNNSYNTTNESGKEEVNNAEFIKK